MAACRINFLFAKDKDDPAKRRRLMLEIGGNLTAEVPTLAYRIADSGEGPQIEWEQDTVAISAEEYWRRNRHASERDPEEARECDEWLKAALSKGPQAQKDLVREGKENGFTERTLNLAKKRLMARSKRHGFGQGGQFEWYLPDKLEKPIDDPDSPYDDH